jgi:hypothetical protein
MILLLIDGNISFDPNYDDTRVTWKAWPDTIQAIFSSYWNPDNVLGIIPEIAKMARTVRNFDTTVISTNTTDWNGSVVFCENTKVVCTHYRCPFCLSFEIVDNPQEHEENNGEYCTTCHFTTQEAQRAYVTARYFSECAVDMVNAQADKDKLLATQQAEAEKQLRRQIREMRPGGA